MTPGDMTPGDKPFSPSCERNRDPILAILRQQFADSTRVLEIGSGTGQHAVHFAAAMPWLAWQCSDVAANLPGIGAWLDEAGLANTPPAIELDVARGPWPDACFDAVFSANAVHIMGWAQVEAMFEGLGGVMDCAPGGARRPPTPSGHPRAAVRGEGGNNATLVLYGPFNYDGNYSSASNRQFDAWLKARDPRSGIRDFEAIDALARGIGLHLVDDIPMPANNRCLAWRR